MLRTSLLPSLLRRLTERRGDRGSVAVFTSVFALAVIFLTALIIDGGIAMNARERAADIAGQAARAAAGDIDVGTLRDTGHAVIAPGACDLAGQLVDHYAATDSGGVDRVNAATMTNCVAPAGGDTARVWVRIHTTSLMGGIIGNFDETADDTATAQCGITQGGNC